MSIAGLQGFLASVANNYRDHYLTMVRDLNQNRTPGHFKSARVDQTAATTYAPTSRVDRYEPSAPVQTKSEAESSADKALPEKTTVPTEDTAAKSSKEQPSSPVTTNPDGTYSYERKAELEYQLDLRFDLAAITRTVESLAEGDTATVEKLAAAGFGLSADFDLDGYQKIKESLDEAAENASRSERTAAEYRNAGAMAYRSKDFAMESFYNESFKVRRSLDESVQDSHRRTTNRFALRYHLDNNFSMAFAERFNIQTTKVAEQMPGATKDYVDAAGEVAAKGSEDLMATFFDAVDGYLDQSEDKLMENVTAFFDKAAAELGFSGSLVDAARDHLTGTITRFFDRVETALAGVEAKFVATSPAATPTQLATSYLDPSAAQDSYALATA